MLDRTIAPASTSENLAAHLDAPPPLVIHLLRELRASVAATVFLAILVCGVYPAMVWALAHAMFAGKADGSLIGRDGAKAAGDAEVAGSALIGQTFTDAKYFHSRPSSAGAGYDPTASGGSNLGPTSAKLFNGTIKKADNGAEIVDFDGLRLRVIHYCIENNVAFDASEPLADFSDARGNLDDVKLIKSFNSERPLTFTPRSAIPADAITASASGLDPHISPANALLQVPRVAQARGLAPSRVQEWVDRYTERPDLGVFGEPRINVLQLNLALDRLAPR
jgi:K+-transporting ATPase ATPase C chain